MASCASDQSASATRHRVPSASCGSVPLFRMFSPKAGDHFYTTNAAEKNNAITSLGYVDEGIAAYVNPSQ